MNSINLTSYRDFKSQPSIANTLFSSCGALKIKKKGFHKIFYDREAYM